MGATEQPHLRCPFCDAYEVDRVYLGTTHLDACSCRACGAQWDEDPTTGQYQGRTGRASGVTPR